MITYILYYTLFVKIDLFKKWHKGYTAVSVTCVTFISSHENNKYELTLKFDCWDIYGSFSGWGLLFPWGGRVEGAGLLWSVLVFLGLWPCPVLAEVGVEGRGMVFPWNILTFKFQIHIMIILKKYFQVGSISLFLCASFRVWARVCVRRCLHLLFNSFLLLNSFSFENIIVVFSRLQRWQNLDVFE